MNSLGLEVGQHLNVLVPYADRVIPCEAQVLTTAGAVMTISPPLRHRVKVPLHSDHIILKVPRSDALYELRCPTEQVRSDLWAITLPGKDGTTRIQRRQFVRVALSHPCRLVVESLPGAPKGRAVPGEVIDLSGGGCAIRTDADFKVGTHVVVVSNLLGGEVPQRLRGTVRRCTQRKDGLVVAVEFRGLGLPLQNALVHLVQTFDLAKKQQGSNAAASTPSKGTPEKVGKRYDRSRFNDWVRS